MRSFELIYSRFGAISIGVEIAIRQSIIIAGIRRYAGLSEIESTHLYIATALLRPDVW